MIELDNDELVIRFPEVHPKAHCTINFQRTLRIADDNREYPLPPGLGNFPLAHVDNLGDRLPENWQQHGGIFFPMYQAEAMWISFDTDYPFAIKVAAGKINAVTGNDWSNELAQDPQDYLVIPDQPWLDGFCIAKGKIRQFVAMPLGEGYSAEEQLTGKAEHGGMQIIAYPMKRSFYEEYCAETEEDESDLDYMEKPMFCRRAVEESVPDMGLAPGGVMRQEIYADDYGLDAWNKETRARCYVHIANSQTYHQLTGCQPPDKPPTARDYTAAGLPWFDYYSDGDALSGSGKLAGLQSLAAKWLLKKPTALPQNETLTPGNIRQLGKNRVREGEF